MKQAEKAVLLALVDRETGPILVEAVESFYGAADALRQANALVAKLLGGVSLEAAAAFLASLRKVVVEQRIGSDPLSMLFQMVDEMKDGNDGRGAGGER